LSLVSQTRSLSLVTGAKASSQEEEKKVPLKDKLSDIDLVKEVFNKKGYTFFETPQKDYNLNLFGVRVENNVSNDFDDYICAIYHLGGEWRTHVWHATTDPGKHWLENPINPKGTAILIPGQYRSTWKLAKHQGKYKALCQRKPVKVWRDNNKDNILDYECEVTDEGFFGINIHRSNPKTQSYLVERWSAGCQVFQKVAQYYEFLDLCDESAARYGNSFTYTLFEESDFDS
jgi:hypothetical protein